jgi:hypothetical protein
MYAISLAQRSKEDKSMSGTKDFHPAVPILHLGQLPIIFILDYVLRIL